MRFGIFLVALAIASGASAQQSPLAQRLSAEIKPYGQAYVACAVQHIQRRAASNPASVFEQHEGSIRPACGGHIDQIVSAFLRYGQTREEAMVWVNSAYLKLQPRLKQAFEATRVSVSAPPSADPARQVERAKLNKGAMDDIAACLKAAFIDVVPFSEERADTLATALVARCEPRYQRWKSLLTALDYAPARADEEYRTRRDADHRELLAQIVTFRSEMRKRGANAQPPTQPGVPVRSY